MNNPVRPLKVAVVGGGIGRQHLAAYLALPEWFEVRAFCDLDEARARAVADEFKVPETITSFDALCARPDLDVIDICTPPHLHFEQCRQALAAGKHVTCEKPLVSSLQEADLLAEAERASGRRLMPIFQYRFGHGLQKLRWLVERGLAGDAFLATVETAWRRRADYYAVPWRGKWRTERGGAVLGHGIHAHDALYYVLGPARSVFARAATRVNAIETEDCASVSLEMANGALATLSVTLGSVDEITRHRFCFRSLVAESGTAPYSNSSEPWKFTADTDESRRAIDAALAEFEPKLEGYQGQFARFAEALAKGGELPVTLADGRNSLELVTAIYHSAEVGQPVNLPIQPDHPSYANWLPDAYRT